MRLGQVIPLRQHGVATRGMCDTDCVRASTRRSACAPHRTPCSFRQLHVLMCPPGDRQCGLGRTSEARVRPARSRAEASLDSRPRYRSIPSNTITEAPGKRLVRRCQSRSAAYALNTRTLESPLDLIETLLRPTVHAPRAVRRTLRPGGRITSPEAATLSTLCLADARQTEADRLAAHSMSLQKRVSDKAAGRPTDDRRNRKANGCSTKQTDRSNQRG